MRHTHHGVINYYQCPCGTVWRDEWCCECDDDCPACGSDCTPAESEQVEPCTHPECTDAGAASTPDLAEEIGYI